MAVKPTTEAGRVFDWRAYQRASIDDPSTIQVKKWCRQSGKDETTAFTAVLKGLSGHRGDWLIGSLTQRQADETHEKCARHARAMAQALCPESESHFDAQVGGQTFGFTRREIRLPSGVRIISLPGRDPDTWAGYSANVILTEFALFPGGGHKHWRVVTPIALTSGLSVYAISTPRGKDTRFYDLCQNPRGRYSVSVVDIRRAVADGLVLRDEEGRPCSVEDFQELYGDPVGWQTEYLVQEGDDLSALLSWDDIEAAYTDDGFALLDLRDGQGYDPARENVFADLRPALSGRLSAGWDVARKHHLGVFWMQEEAAGRQALRLLVLFRRCSFPFQADGIISQAMNTLSGLVGRGDSTGLGMESNERLEARFGKLRWQGVNFAGSKVSLASRLQTTCQARRLAIPRKAEIVAYDLHALQQQRVGDRLVVSETANALEPDSHCDIAWAAALAQEAASVDVAQPFVSVGD